MAIAKTLKYDSQEAASLCTEYTSLSERLSLSFDAYAQIYATSLKKLQYYFNTRVK